MIAWRHEQRYLRGGMQEGKRGTPLRTHARYAIAAGGDDAAGTCHCPGFVMAVAGADFETVRSHPHSIGSFRALSKFVGLITQFQFDRARLEG